MEPAPARADAIHVQAIAEGKQMINLARAITTAGVALAVSLVAVPSASAVVREAGPTAARAAALEHRTPAQKEAAQKKSAGKADAKNLAPRPLTVDAYYVMQDGRVTSEQGPGDSAAHEVATGSGDVGLQTRNESVRTGDLQAQVDGKQTGSPVTFEVEGSEQDTGEVS